MRFGLLGPSAFALSVLATASANSASAQDADAAASARKQDAEVRAAEAAARAADAAARTAEIEAEVKAATALYDAIPGSNAPAEKVVLGEGAGKAEAMLMSTAALQRGAVRIAAAVRVEATKPARNKLIVLAPTSADPSLGRWRAYELRSELIARALTESVRLAENLAEAVPPRRPPGGIRQQGAALAAGALAVGQAIGAGAKLASFFQSQYEIRGVSFTPDEQLLQSAVLASLVQPGDVEVFQPSRLGRSADRFQAELLRLDALASQAAVSLARAQATAAPLRAAAAKPENAARAADLLAQARPFEDAASRLTAALSGYSQFITDLSAADSKTALPLVEVMMERELAELLERDALLLTVKPYGQNGSFYSKTNLWTFLGGEMPFKVSGSSVIGYRLSDKQGRVLAAGVISDAEPYTPVTKVATYGDDGTRQARRGR